MQGNYDTGCCLRDEEFHRRCICDHISDQVYCRSLCSNDPGCKGYAMLDNAKDSCQLATTSACSVSCSKEGDDADIGPIDPDAKCGNGSWNGGCFIKRGIAGQDTF